MSGFFNLTQAELTSWRVAKLSVPSIIRSKSQNNVSASNVFNRLLNGKISTKGFSFFNFACAENTLGVSN